MTIENETKSDTDEEHKEEKPKKKQAKRRKKSIVSVCRPGHNITSMDLLTCFLFECSQALKAFYLDSAYSHAQRKCYTFVRDYSAFFPLAFLSRYAMSRFALPVHQSLQAISELAAPLPPRAQKLVLAYLGCCLAPEVVYEGTLRDWMLSHPSVWDRGENILGSLDLMAWTQSTPTAMGHLLKHKNGDLQLRLPSKQYFYDFGRLKLLNVIASVEGCIAKRQVCWILDLQSKYIDPSSPHSLILSVKVDGSSGLLLVPHDAGFSELDDYLSDALPGLEARRGYAYLHMNKSGPSFDWRGGEAAALARGASHFRSHLITLLEKNEGKAPKSLYAPAEERGRQDYAINCVPPDCHSEKNNSDILKAMYESSCGFTSLTFRVSGAYMRSLDKRYGGYGEHGYSKDSYSEDGYMKMKVLGSQRELLCSTMMELDDSWEESFERANFEYLEDCAIADAFPTLEESYFMPASDLLKAFPDKAPEYGNMWTPFLFDKIELNWTKSDSIAQLAVVGRAPRLPKEDYPVFKKSSNPFRYW